MMPDGAVPGESSLKDAFPPLPADITTTQPNRVNRSTAATSGSPSPSSPNELPSDRLTTSTRSDVLPSWFGSAAQFNAWTTMLLDVSPPPPNTLIA